MEQAPSQIEQAEAALNELIAGAVAWDASCDRAAAHLAQALVESGMERGEAFRRLRALGLSGRAIRGLLANAQRVVRQRRQAVEDQQFAGATAVCPHCLQPISPTDHFCPKCCGPVSAYASIDPLGQVYSAGTAYRQAVSGRPRPIVFAAMWLIFGPPVPFLLYLTYLNLLALGAFGPQDRWEYVQSDGLFLDLLKLVLVAGLMALNAAILWKMTARWVSSRRSSP